MRPALCIVLAALLLGCDGGGSGSDGGDEPSIPPPQTEIGALAIAPYHYTEPPPATPSELLQRNREAVRLARDAGATAQFQAYTWAYLEPVAGRYDEEHLAEFENTTPKKPTKSRRIKNIQNRTEPNSWKMMKSSKSGN